MITVAGMSHTMKKGYRTKFNQPSEASGPLSTTVATHSSVCAPAAAIDSHPSQAGKALCRNETTATATSMTTNGRLPR